MTLKGFIKKWDRKPYEDDGCYMSEDAKKFVSDFRSMLKSELGPDYDVKINPNHYDLSGFIAHDGLYVYVSYNMRNQPEPRILVDASGCMAGVLYRSARDPKDFIGGHNNFCTLRNVADSIREHFEMQKKCGFF